PHERVGCLSPRVGKVLIILAIDGSGLIGKRIQIDQVQGYRVELAFRNDITRDGLTLVAAIRRGHGTVWIVNLILRSDCQPGRKLTRALGWRGNRVGLAVGVRRRSIAVLLPCEKEKRLIAAVVDFRREYRPAQRHPVTVILIDRVFLAGFVDEKVGTVER